MRQHDDRELIPCMFTELELRIIEIALGAFTAQNNGPDAQRGLVLLQQLERRHAQID